MRNRYLLLSVFLSLAGSLVIADAAQAQRSGRRSGGGNIGNVYRGGGSSWGNIYWGGSGNGYGPYENYNRGYRDSYYAPSYYESSPYLDNYVVPRDSYYPPTVNLQPVQPEQALSSSASIHVLLPDPQARVWVDGNMTRQTGAERFFSTPSLSPGGSYSYQIRATWMQDGREVTREQMVSVRPGQTSMADFTRNASENIPAPRSGG